MPVSRQLLLTRLDEIGSSLARSKNAIALIGLGSVGVEVDRLDDYSDLDFFAVVKEGFKSQFLDDLTWLSSICPIAYCYRNTPDGYKLLFRDGVFCEFAVFEKAELGQIPFAPGRIIWKKATVSNTLALPQRVKNVWRNPSLEWSLGEALSSLYVGISRFRRGERLSAMRLIQCYAVDRILELSEKIEPAVPAPQDAFASERRYEQRHPAIAEALPTFSQGYDRSVESAQAILSFLEGHFQVNPFLKQEILDLCNYHGSAQSE
jgi:lincosamide nucleotidyltransferase